jgi:Uma2 family endonuclease
MTIAIAHPTQQKPITFEEFLIQYRDDDRYELIDGAVFDLEPTGPHEEVAAFIDRKLNVQIDTLELPYFLPQRCLVKPLGDWTGFRPKQPTLTICTLNSDGSYDKRRFRGGDAIVSTIFPNLTLTAAAVLGAGR